MHSVGDVGACAGAKVMVVTPHAMVAVMELAVTA